MAHFAKVNKDNIVENVVVVPDEKESVGNEYLNEIGLEGTWIQCSFNNKIRNVFPGKGYLYNAELDVFLDKKPFNSWVLNESSFEWEAPSPAPEYNDETHFVEWDEETLSWTILEKPADTE